MRASTILLMPYSIRELAEKIGAKKATVQSWASKGFIASYRVRTPRGLEYRVSDEEAERIIREYGEIVSLKQAAAELGVDGAVFAAAAKRHAFPTTAGVSRVGVRRSDFPLIKAYFESRLKKEGELYANEFAKQARVTFPTVRRWIEAGFLKGERRGGNWFVPASELSRVEQIKESAAARRLTGWRETVRARGGLKRPGGLAVKLVMGEHKGWHAIATALGIDASTLYSRIKKGRIKVVQRPDGVKEIPLEEQKRLERLAMLETIPSLARKHGVSRLFMTQLIERQKIPVEERIDGLLGVHPEHHEKIRMALAGFAKQPHEMTASEFAKAVGISNTGVYALYKKGELSGRLRTGGVQPVLFIPRTEVGRVKELLSSVVPLSEAARQLGKSRAWLENKLREGELEPRRTLFGLSGLGVADIARLKQKTHYSLPELVNKWGVSRTALWNAISGGRIKAEKKSGKWSVPVAEVERIERQLSDFLPLPEAAKIVGLQPETLRRYRRQGILNVIERPLFSTSATRFGVPASLLKGASKVPPSKELWRRLASGKPLTPPMEKYLLLRAKLGDSRASEALFNSHKNSVMRFARKILGRRDAEIEAEAKLGYFEAVRAVDLNTLTEERKFLPYALWYVKGAVFNALNAQGRLVKLPYHVRAKLREFDDARSKLQQTLGRPPSPEEIAAEMGVKVSEVTKFFEVPRSQLSMDAQLAEDEKRTLHDVLGTEDAQLALRENSLREVLLNAIERLPKLHRDFVRNRFGFVDGVEKTPYEAGELLGLSQEQARSIQREAFEMLRKTLKQTR